MINGEKIGVGIVTCNRPELYKKLVASLEQCYGIVDCIAVCQDTITPNPEFMGYITGEDKWYWWESLEGLEMIIFNENLGVGESKNTCLKSLRRQDCDHIFLIEDDIFIKDPKVFEKYIEASKTSGIQHFNFSQHGVMNKTYGFGVKDPNPRHVITYSDGVAVALYPHCVGAFSYYSRNCLNAVGFIDEEYFNACEHVDHTYQIIKYGMHPPFWYFADIDKSWEYLGDEEWSIENSTISSNPKHKQMMQEADKIFVKKHGLLPGQIPLVDFAELGKQLKSIKNNYGANLTNV